LFEGKVIVAFVLHSFANLFANISFITWKWLGEKVAVIISVAPRFWRQSQRKYRLHPFLVNP